MTVGLKDTIAVEGLPLTLGSAIMDGYRADVDATIVTRILSAGAEIIGKTNCDDLSFAGGGHTPATGRVVNPYDLTRLAGGSSGGSAAAVAAGECDLAIGGDQGGSIRIPCSWCGASGLKPTYGLVPYTGIASLEASLDHAGPIARSVEDIALLLDVIAGPDGIDSRQHAYQNQSYRRAIRSRLDGLRIGVLEEGFGWAGRSEPDVDEIVKEAASRFARLGGRVRKVSIPIHRQAHRIWNAINNEGSLAVLINGNGIGRGVQGYYPETLMQFYGQARRRQGAKLPATVKLAVLVGQYLSDRHYGVYYAKAQNLRRTLADGYDEAFKDVDLLLMPTTPMKAAVHSQDQEPDRYFELGSANHLNTCAFNLSGHPALSIPCALSGGLPVGLMLVGRRMEDALLLKAGDAFQHAFASDLISPVAPH